MKREIKEMSAELFIKYLPVPKDLKIVDVVFEKDFNSVKIYGYSEEYFDEPEGNHATNKLIIEDDFKEMLRGKYAKVPLFGYIL